MMRKMISPGKFEQGVQEKMIFGQEINKHMGECHIYPLHFFFFTVEVKEALEY